MRPFAWLLLLALSNVSAAQTPQMVNVSRDSTQRAPRIARAADGRMLVVWQSYVATDLSRPRITMRWLAPDGTPDGAEFAVAPTARPNASWRFRHHGAQEQPALALHPSGLAAIAWVEFDSVRSYDIRLRLISGTKIVDVPVMDQAEADEIAQSRPSVDVNEGGIVAIAWDTWLPGFTQQVVKARLFDTSGAALGPALTLNDLPGGSALRPVIRLRPDSTALVVYEAWINEAQYTEPDGSLMVPTSSGTGLMGRMLKPTGLGPAPMALVNQTLNDYQWQATVERSADGFAVAWCSWEQDGDDGAIVFSQTTADGWPHRTERIVNATTRFHQWLPRLVRRPSGYAAVWSSWKTDGDREGVFAALLDPAGRRTSFETQVNQTGASFQWEPDAVMIDDTTAVVVWSEWFGEGNDYDVMVRRMSFERPVGTLASGTPNAGGRSTARFVPHVVDRNALTGHVYEASVTSVSGDTAVVAVTDMTAAQVRLASYRVDRGIGFQYLTPGFDGLRLEVFPQFTLALDAARSGMATPGGIPSPFVLTLPTAGTPNLAPIDLTLTFGPRDTLADGSYRAPLDTAINVSGQRVVRAPFRAWNLTDNARIDLLVVDLNANARWDRGEKIVFRTPIPYRTAINHTHAELAPGLVTSPLPDSGGVFAVYTVRPMTTADRFQFTADAALVVHAEAPVAVPRSVRLEPNYPNPFNPTTKIAFEIDRSQKVTLEVYDLLGRLIEVLVNEERPAGRYVAPFHAQGRSSGMYLVVLRTDGFSIARRMMLVK
ncbi:MAG: T9SS type A sorting domain-containing protein [Bacteroidetes bacterium]|jgi:hypothetical protein|nr:T9SS type A sorting domain-containing protein [Bacteroidota bacterium]